MVRTSTSHTLLEIALPAGRKLVAQVVSMTRKKTSFLEYALSDIRIRSPITGTDTSSYLHAKSMTTRPTVFCRGGAMHCIVAARFELLHPGGRRRSGRRWVSRSAVQGA
ncbi:hypothetical protein RIF29_21157 [Crotalaria pallida]|uniref:Uncharacterized protein n=1 Tax=Crotalaria pallida TaxID=3830 RepID=A0AAN9FB16_CROPI